MDTKNMQQTSRSAAAWGWPVWGCVQKFSPSLLFFKSYPISSKFTYIAPLNKKLYATLSLSTQASVVQKLDSAIQRINHYPVDKC